LILNYLHIINLRELAKEFEAYISRVAVVNLPFGKDPDDLTREEIYRCIEETIV